MNEKMKEKAQMAEIERDLGIVSLMGFDSARFSFLALLVIKSYRKIEKCNFPILQQKNFKKLSYYPSGRHKKFSWPVMIVKLRIRQKYSKI